VSGSDPLLLVSRGLDLFEIAVRENQLSVQHDPWTRRLDRWDRSVGEKLDVCGGGIC
jgi:hypothetical protein